MRIMITFIVFILSINFVIGFVGFSSKPLPICGGLGLIVRGWLWYCIKFWWVFLGSDSILNLFRGDDGSFWLYNSYGYRAVP